jgi:hypothetical protein
MYWIYLILFILAVFTPDIIQHDFSFVPEEKAEELLIFVLGALAFLIFLQKEKQLFIKTKEKTKIQKEALTTSKDLTDTYSYIGEINRKVDILKDIALGITEGPGLTPEKETELYGSILHAVQIFSKSSRVSLNFVDTKSGKIIKAVKSGKKTECDAMNYRMVAEKKNFLETDKSFFIRSPKAADGVVACISIEKITKHQAIDDPELIKALASQALFLFTYTKKAK